MAGIKDTLYAGLKVRSKVLNKEKDQCNVY